MFNSSPWIRRSSAISNDTSTKKIFEICCQFQKKSNVGFVNRHAMKKGELMKVQCISFQTGIQAVRNLCQHLAGTAALLLVIGAATVSAQSLTTAERDRALQYPESTKKNILEATAGLSQAQWNFKSAPDRWSIAQVMEQIATSEDFIRENLLKEKVMVAPAGDPGRDVKRVDEAVVTMIPDRTHKAQAPEPLVPTNRFGSPMAPSNILWRAGRQRSSFSEQQLGCANT
jgi:DinB family protein